MYIFCICWMRTAQPKYLLGLIGGWRDRHISISSFLETQEKKYLFFSSIFWFWYSFIDGHFVVGHQCLNEHQRNWLGWLLWYRWRLWRCNSIVVIIRQGNSGSTFYTITNCSYGIWTRLDTIMQLIWWMLLKMHFWLNIRCWFDDLRWRRYGHWWYAIVDVIGRSLLADTRRIQYEWYVEHFAFEQKAGRCLNLQMGGHPGERRERERERGEL